MRIVFIIDSKSMGVPCYYCKFVISKESAVGSQLLRHIKLFHSNEWTKFARTPVLYPLVSWSIQCNNHTDQSNIILWQ